MIPGEGFRVCKVQDITNMSANKSYLLDMDGVLVRGSQPIPGAQQFIERLVKSNTRFAILTNNPMHTPRDLQHRLKNVGLEVPDDCLFTSAMATAHFLQTQMPNGSAFAIGETGLTTALHEVGYVLTERDPDYVVLGETTNYSFERISKAVRLVAAGARFIATNPDASGPSEKGIEPACGAMAALIQKATGIAPYFIGKPNPLMVRSALRFLGAHSEEAGNGRRSDGHGCSRRYGKRHANDIGADRSCEAGRCDAFPLPPDNGACLRRRYRDRVEENPDV